MMQVTTPQGLKTLPRKGSWWRHRNGNLYRVVMVTNLSDRQAEYPVTISYVGPNGKEWSKQAHDWFEKMTPLSKVLSDWLDQHLGQALSPELAAEFMNLWSGIEQQMEDGGA